MKPKIHWCTPITGGDRLKLVEYSDYEKLQAENERLRKIELHLNSRIQQIERQIDDPEILTTRYILYRYDTLTQLKLDIEQLTKTEKGAQNK